MAVSSALSPLESLVGILGKLGREEFTSKRISRHVAIRGQIRTLIESREELQSLSSALHEGATGILASLPAKKGGQHSFQASLWPLFHTFRVRDVPRIWKNVEHVIPDLDAILIQKATMQYVVLLLQQMHGIQSSECSTVEDTRKRRETVTVEEENAIRYTAGYIAVKLQEVYAHKGLVAVCQCLVSMAAESSKSETAEAASFLAYTRTWLDITNRGGLFIVSDDVYKFFLELELCMYMMLKERLGNGSGQQSKDDLIQTIRDDEDVLFAWSLVTTNLSEDESQLLLTDVIQLWVTVRGFSIASRLLEDYKLVSGSLLISSAALSMMVARSDDRSSWTIIVDCCCTFSI